MTMNNSTLFVFYNRCSVRIISVYWLMGYLCSAKKSNDVTSCGFV